MDDSSDFYSAGVPKLSPTDGEEAEGTEWGARMHLEGFTYPLSYTNGEQINFYLSFSRTMLANHDAGVEAFDLGIYLIQPYKSAGPGALENERCIAVVDGENLRVEFQVTPSADTKSGMLDCSNWRCSASITLTDQFLPGLYVARIRSNTNKQGCIVNTESPIIFVVKSRHSHPDIVVQTSDQTWQAYNEWGGGSLYGMGEHYHDPALRNSWPASIRRQLKVSYKRPLRCTPDSFKAEKAFAVWLQTNCKGSTVAYASAADVASGDLARLKPKLFISVGHDEYWSTSQRTNVDNARRDGTNLLFLSGDTCFWQISRKEASSNLDVSPIITCLREPVIREGDCSREAISRHQIICRVVEKGLGWTGAWRDTFRQPCPYPESFLTGLGWRFLTGKDSPASQTEISVSLDESKGWLWEKTKIYRVGGKFGKGVMDYEWDGLLKGPMYNIRCHSTTPVYAAQKELPSSSATAKQYEWRDCIINDGQRTIVNGDTETGCGRSPDFAVHNIVEFQICAGAATTISVGLSRWCEYLDDPIVNQVTRNTLKRLA